MIAALRAGTAYFALTFSLGFALGTVRVLAFAPAVGETGATLIELPIMLAASWLACGWCARRFDVSGSWPPRAAMGGFAFALLMFAEALLAILLADRTLGDHLARYAETGPALGLAAQLAFAGFPVLRR